MRRFHPLRASLPAPLLGSLFVFGSLAMGPPLAHAQEHPATGDAELSVEVDSAASELTVRVGPLSLPAETHHGRVAQAPDLYLTLPVEGWLLAYRPQLVDGRGEVIPGRLLHHVAFWNTERPDLLCPEKQEHVFGAGGEMNVWPALPGVGYRVQEGDRFRVSTMFHNPTDTDYPEVYLEVEVTYRPRSAASEPLEAVYPVWFDVQECGESAYDLAPGENVDRGEFTMPYGGRLLGVGGHLHDYSRSLRLTDRARDRVIAYLQPRLDREGRIVSMPIVPFLATGGYQLEEGDTLQVTARYENPTGRRLEGGAMGIAVGYFQPDDPEAVASLREEGR